MKSIHSSILQWSLQPIPSTKMRVVVKGGVWKNTEDEILKVAV
jgi:hypothetical protein